MIVESAGEQEPEGSLVECSGLARCASAPADDGERSECRYQFDVVAAEGPLLDLQRASQAKLG
jgi:hypothetical protein